MGRQRPFSASGSCRWLGLVAASLTRLCFQPPNVKFRGTADGCQRNWPTSGIGVRRHSQAKSELLLTVWSRWWHGDSQRQLMAGNGFSLSLLQADFAGPGHCTEGQLPGPASNSL